MCSRANGNLRQIPDHNTPTPLPFTLIIVTVQIPTRNRRHVTWSYRVYQHGAGVEMSIYSRKKNYIYQKSTCRVLICISCDKIVLYNVQNIKQNHAAMIERASYSAYSMSLRRPDRQYHTETEFRIHSSMPFNCHCDCSQCKSWLASASSRWPLASSCNVSICTSWHHQQSCCEIQHGTDHSDSPDDNDHTTSLPCAAGHSD